MGKGGRTGGASKQSHRLKVSPLAGVAIERFSVVVLVGPTEPPVVQLPFSVLFLMLPSPWELACLKANSKRATSLQFAQLLGAVNEGLYSFTCRFGAVSLLDSQPPSHFRLSCSAGTITMFVLLHNRMGSSRLWFSL